MRVLTCLSQNVSMVYDTAPQRSKRWTERLGIKNRKRKKMAATGSAAGGAAIADSTMDSRKPYDQPGTKYDGSRSLYCSRIDIENKENGDPYGRLGMVDENIENVDHVSDRLVAPGCASTYRKRSLGFSSTSSSSSSSSSYFIPRRTHHPPLPPIPGEGDNLNASIYVKELNDSQCDALDADYLPLSEVLSPLREDASIDNETSPTSSESTDISVGTYEALAPQPIEPKPVPKLRGSETFPVLTNPTPRTLLQTLRGPQTLKRPTAKPSALRRLYSPPKPSTSSSSTTNSKYSSRGSCQSSASSKGSSSCSVGSTTSSVISSGLGFNKAFIDSAGSLVSQHQNPSAGSLLPHQHCIISNTNPDTQQRVPPIYHPDVLTPPSPFQISEPTGAADRNSPCGASPTILRRSSPSGACLPDVLTPAKSLDSSGSIFVSSMSEDSSPSLTSMVAMRGGIIGTEGGDPYTLDADDEAEITQDDMTQVTQETLPDEGTQWRSQGDGTQWDTQEFTQEGEEESMQEDFEVTQENESDIYPERPSGESPRPIKDMPFTVTGPEEPQYVNAICPQLVGFQDSQHLHRLEGPLIRVFPMGEPAQPYGSARVNEFRQHVVNNPDPYDTMEDDEYLDLDNLQGPCPSREGGHSDIDVDVAGNDGESTAAKAAAAVVVVGRDDVGNGASDVNNGRVVCPSSSASEFLGCMSFGVQHLLKKDLNGWYYLLTEEVGRKKHLQARSRPQPAVLTATSHNNIPEINTAVEGQERIMITVQRGKNGFGFSFIDELPPRVGRVDRASPAEQAGIKRGDAVIRINGKNVSRSTCEGVARMIKKMSPQSLTLELQRDHIIAAATTEVTATGTTTTTDVGQNLGTKRGVGTSTDHLYESIREGTERPGLGLVSEHYKENMARMDHLQAGEEFITDVDDDDAALAYPHHGMPTNPSVTSTPRPVITRGLMHQASAASPGSAHRSMTKQESIHRLMSIELDYIDFMHYGIERYSRPLRHCIVSAHQHRTIFQNVEKMVTISEFHIKQMQDSTSSVNSDTDDSQSSGASLFPNSVALIYFSKIHMFCQAYEDYAHGLVRSNALLRELRKNKDFMSFIKETGSDDGQNFGHPSISAFINRPVQHIQELHSVLSDIFSSTPLSSPDFHTLQQVAVKLAHCVANIAGLSSAGRVQSVDSLTSSAGGSSTYSNSHHSQSHSRGGVSGRSQQSQVYHHQGAAGAGSSRICSQSTSSGKGSMASLASSCSSTEREAPPTQPLLQASASVSATPSGSVNRDVLRIQECLVFAAHVQAFQLCQEERHLIFQGQIFRQELRQNSSSSSAWCKSLLLLFSDLLMVVDEVADEDGVDGSRQLLVPDDPVAIQDIVGIEVHRKYASEFILHVCPSGSHVTPAVFRASSSQEKFVWTSLLEQRVLAVKGSRLQHYGSIRDISSVKTSVIL